MVWQNEFGPPDSERGLFILTGTCRSKRWRNGSHRYRKDFAHADAANESFRVQGV
jgi:hypothetical protein